MAGDPAPLAAVQAAVMKSSAAAQGQTEPAPTGGAFQGAIAQDLAVMADQAKGYSAGVAAGNVEAENQRGAASSRMALEASQAAAARQRQIQMAQMDTNQARLRLAQQQQEGQIRLRDQAREAEERLRAATEAERGSPDERAEVKAAENAYRIKNHARANESPDFALTFDNLTQQATTYREFMDLYDNYSKQDPTLIAGAEDRNKIARYARVYFDSVAAGKPLMLSRLPRPKNTSRPNRATENEPDDGGDGLFEGFTRSLRGLFR